MTYVVRIQLTEEDDGTSRVFSDFEDPYVREADTPGDIYRRVRAEYGRCRSKVFNETKDGTVSHVGWFFVKRERYGGDPTNGTYLQGAWVTVYREVEPARDRVLEAGF